MTAPHKNWHETPIAQRLIARLDHDNLKAVRQVGIPCDFYVWRGVGERACRTLIALSEMRHAAIDEAMGFTFAEANTDSIDDRRHAYVAASSEAPEVYDVVKAALDRRTKVAA